MPLSATHLEDKEALRMEQLALESIPHPSTYGIPHPEWREHQFETVIWNEAQSGFIINEAPTGSGKSATAAALSTNQRVVVLTQTKILQDQYGDPYKAAVVKGKSNYECVHPDAEPNTTCSDCLFNDTSMHRCPYYRSTCPYGIAKEKALSRYTSFVCANYAYWLVSARLRESKIGLLVCDEAHLLPDVVLNWAGLTMNDIVRQRWSLDKFPVVGSHLGLYEARDWLEASMDILRAQWKVLQFQAENGDDEAKKEARQCERLGYKLKATAEAIDSSPDGWYVKSGPGVGYYQNRPVPGIVCKPVTARYHTRKYFGYCADEDDYNMLLMSATIGDFDTFTQELGVRKYVGRIVPSRYPPDTRPIYILPAPKMRHKTTKLEYEKQADLIASSILSCPPEWSGIVHVTRKTEGKLLAERLARRGLQDRVWSPPLKDRRGRYLGTTEQAEAWEERKKRYPGSIMCAWQFATGFDGLDEKICVVAKTQFPALGKPGSYERTRMEFSHKMYNLRTALTLVQSCGRTRRGRDEDYDLNGERRGFVAIADSNYTRVSSYMPKDFRDSLVIL